jgi:hypothetical protein
MVYKEIILKPLKIQMLIDFPELREDDLFLNSLDLEFNSNDLFEEWKKISNLQKRVDVITSISGLQDAEGKPYFHLEFLVDKYLKLSEDEKQENQAYKLKYEGGAATGEASAETAEGSAETPAPEGGEEPAPGGEEAGGGDFEF